MNAPFRIPAPPRIPRRALALAAILLLTSSAGAELVHDHTRIAHGAGGISTLHAGSGFGMSIAALGDLDRDGVVDVAVGANADPGAGAPPSGAVFVLFLKRDGTVRAVERITPISAGLDSRYLEGAGFGYALAAVGDLDGDGNVDLAASTIGPDERGSVHVLFLNQTGTVRESREIPRDHPGFSGARHFGQSLEVVGDVDGDGAVELAIGDSQFPRGGVSRGLVWFVELDERAGVVDVHSLAPGDAGFGEPVGDHTNFATGLARLGDLDGDGTIELAVGAAYADEGTDNTGAAWIVSIDDGFRVKAYRKISSIDPAFAGAIDYEDGLGLDATRLDDLDGDGIPELALASGSHDGFGFDRGVVWIAFLSSDGSLRRVAKIGEASEGLSATLVDHEWFGSSVESIGDVDGDGISELAVGSTGHPSGGQSAGALRILFLRASDVVDSTRQADANPNASLASPPPSAAERGVTFPYARSFRRW